jgi:uncharacterized membrane protein YfhO
MSDLWSEPGLNVFDPRQVAWLEQNKLSELSPFLSNQSAGLNETVAVTYPAPQRAVLEATLQSPGLVVLSDVDYPGWELTIDGRPAPIYRVNKMMRGAAVPAGTHRLVYSYHPRSFTIGLIVSALSAAAMVPLCILVAKWPVDPNVGPTSPS